MAGALLLTAKGMLVQVVGLGGTIVFARALHPAGLGVVTFGFTITALVSTISGGNSLGAALIRAPEEPSGRDLQALLALQLTLSVGVGAVAAAAAVAFAGHAGRVAALMLLAVPLGAIRAPAAVTLERNLRYRALATSEGLEAVVYYAIGGVAVTLGSGVWGVAAASLVGTFATSIATIRLSTCGVVWPRPSLPRWRTFLSFGGRLQAQQLLQTVRNEGVNLGIAAVGGLHMLGVWRVAAKLLQVPQLAFAPAARVTFPALSRAIERGLEPAPRLRRILRLTAVGTGGLLITVVALAPAVVPRLFGPVWLPAADAIAVAAPGLLLVVPIGVAFNGYLWTTGDASTPLRAALVSAIVWPIVALPLLPSIGLLGVGVGLTASAWAHSLVLWWSVRRRLGDAAAAPLSVAVPAAVVAGGVGYAIATAGDAGLTNAAVAELVAVALYVLVLLIFDRVIFAELSDTLGRAARLLGLAPSS
jgi:O-antigen/teichoic acid export membrane protein